MPRPSRSSLTLLSAALVAFATAALFSPARHGAWLFWDDRLFVADNAHLVFTAAGLRWMLTALYGGAYEPLAFLTFAADRLLWGQDAGGYHWTSVALHALNAGLVYALARALLEAARPKESARRLSLAAALAALFFAFHPLRVESVAWISERRALLAAALYLAAVLAYLRRRLRLSALLVLLSAGAKAVAITAPLVLLTLDWYPLRRLPADPRDWARAPREVWLEKLPFCAAALAAAAVGWLAQLRGNAVWSLSEYGPGARLAQAAYGLAFYARKTVWPSGLSPFYDLTTMRSALEPRFWLSGLAVLAAFAAAWRARRSHPACLASLAVYALVLLPVLGFSQSGLQLVADRYSYLSCIPLALLAAGEWLSAAESPLAREQASAAAVCAVAGLAALTLRQLPVWKDSESLWSRAVQEEPGSYFSRNNLGFALTQENRLDDAATQFEEAVALNPDCGRPETRRGKLCTEARVNLLVTRTEQGRFQEAVDGFERLLVEQPDNAAAARGLARAQARMAEHDR